MTLVETHKLQPGRVENAQQIYNCLDTCLTYEIFEVLSTLRNQLPEVYNFERALQAPAMEMMLRGFAIDEAERQKGISLYKGKIAHLQEQLNILSHAVWDKGLNPNSPKQLIDFFYGEMHLPVQHRFDKGQRKVSTNREALEKLELHFHARPIIATILALRDYSKRLSVLETEVDPDGRMRTSYNIAGTETWRWSSSANSAGTGTNLQNISPDLRRMFVADPGFKLCGIDLEQAESREVGWLCGTLFNDWSYLEACYGGDLHTVVCKANWKHLAWTGDPRQDRAIADGVAYRDYSFRDLAKKLGHGCLTGEHEVLTQTGWVKMEAIENGLPIMAWDYKTGQTKWETPSNWIRKEWFGDLINFEGQSYSMQATSDHRMPTVNSFHSKLIKPAEVIKNARLPITANFVGGIVPVTIQQAQLHAAMQADGHIEPWGGIRFGFVKQRKIVRLRNLLQGYNYAERIGKNGETRFTVYKPDFVFAGKFAGQYLLDWNKEALEAYTAEHLHWDGCDQGYFKWVTGKSRDHIWWLYCIARLTGQGSQYAENPTFSVARMSYNARQMARAENMTITKEASNGRMVYCPTLASGGFVVRRNEHLMLSLNSNYYGQPPTMARHAKVPRPMVEVFQKEYFTRFPGIPKWHRWTAQQLQTTRSVTTPFGVQRHFFGRPGDDTTLREAIAFSPQSSTALRLNLILWRIWKHMGKKVQILAQVHDALYFQYPETTPEAEEELIREALSYFTIPMHHDGHELIVPGEAKVGWNWANFDPENPAKNPDGLKKFKPTAPDLRKRTPPATPIPFLDRQL